MQDTEF